MSTRMQMKNDLTGRVFGKLTVAGPGKASKGIGALSPVVCTCGRKEQAWNHLLLKGRKQACANCLTPNALPAREADFR